MEKWPRIWDFCKKITNYWRSQNSFLNVELISKCWQFFPESTFLGILVENPTFLEMVFITWFLDFKNIILRRKAHFQFLVIIILARILQFLVMVTNSWRNLSYGGFICQFLVNSPILGSRKNKFAAKNWKILTRNCQKVANSGQKSPNSGNFRARILQFWVGKLYGGKAAATKLIWIAI